MNECSAENFLLLKYLGNVETNSVRHNTHKMKIKNGLISRRKLSNIRKYFLFQKVLIYLEL